MDTLLPRDDAQRDMGAEEAPPAALGPSRQHSWLCQIWCISIIFQFIDVIIIRRRYRDLFQRIRIAPDWVFYLCSATGTVASIFGISIIFTSSWTGGSKFTGQWDMWIASITAASLLVAAVSFYIGQRTLKSDLQDEKIIEVVTN